MDLTLRVLPLILFTILSMLPALVIAQVSSPKVEAPDGDEIFTEDLKDVKEKKEKDIKQIIGVEAPRDQNVDFKAPQVEFDKENNEVKGTGGVLISGDGIQVQADQGDLNLTTKDVSVSGGVVVSDTRGTLSAQAGRLNMDTETGTFATSRFLVEEGGYEVQSSSVHKVTDIRYELYDSSFSTCHCSEDKTKPWSINCSEANITQEGYAHTYNTTFDIRGVPILYTPYFGFPVKTERTSGLLLPRIGYSGEDGVIYHQPVFVVVNDSIDMTFKPFTETKTRTGLSYDYRQDFSRDSRLGGRFYYSDESARDGSLRGTVTDNIFDQNPSDPQLYDDSRFGGFFKQQWNGEINSDFRFGLSSDIHYISDSLFLREMNDPEVGDARDRYTVSTVVGRANLGQNVTAEVSGEYDQSIETDQDFQLQRLPEARIEGTDSWRPFGYNPLGIKLNSKARVVTTDFVREEGYDGWRTDLNPILSVPLRYKNYFNSSFGFSLNQTYYSMRDTNFPGSTTSLEDSSFDRTIGQAGYTASTAIERVFDLEPGNWLSNLASYGSRNQDNLLTRVKHVIEPQLSYLYIPDTSQDNLPFYDSFDRVRERSVVTYGAKTTLLGRFLPRNRAIDELAELTPRPQDLPMFSLDQPLDEFGVTTPTTATFGDVAVRQGEIRELLSLIVKQSFDYKEHVEDNDSLRHGFSDIGTDLGLYPTKDFVLSVGSNYSPEENDLSEWHFGFSTRDDRGDAIRARYTYIRDRTEPVTTLSQLEGNIEIVLTDRLKTGYYARYDEEQLEVIDQRVGFRISSACDCWHFDIGFRDTLNPNKQMYLVNFTFGGLGGISQDVFTNRHESSN